MDVEATDKEQISIRPANQQNKISSLSQSNSKKKEDKQLVGGKVSLGVLSFDDELDDGESAGSFQVKKTNHSQKMARQREREKLEARSRKVILCTMIILFQKLNKTA